jgi:hypothetical protein
VRGARARRLRAQQKPLDAIQRPTAYPCIPRGFAPAKI